MDMKRFCLTMIAAVLTVAAAAQEVLSGRVTDADTGQPIAGVTVYLDGTSFNTTTNKEGNYILRVPQQSRNNLIFSHLSYRITALPDPFSKPHQDIAMKPRNLQLEQVVVDGNKKLKRAYDYDRRMEAFKEMFLGTTDAGRSCEILNEDDINLVYDPEQKILSAYATKPIRFVNKYLGYTVEFTLLEFKAHYFPDANNLNQHSTGESYFSGMTMFHDDAPDNQRINTNRTLVFSKSPTYFFRNLVHDRLYEGTGFRMFSNGELIDPDDFFTVSDTLGMKLVSIRPEAIAASQTNKLPKGVCAAVYITIGGAILTDSDRGQVVMGTREYDPAQPMRAKLSDEYVDMKSLSRMYFCTDKFLVDYYGNLLNPNAVRFSGEFGQTKAGDMLPDDFRPRSRAAVREVKKAAKTKGETGTSDDDVQQADSVTQDMAD